MYLSWPILIYCSVPFYQKYQSEWPVSGPRLRARPSECGSKVTSTSLLSIVRYLHITIIYPFFGITLQMLAVRDKSSIFMQTSSARFLFDPLHDQQLCPLAGNRGMSAFLSSVMFLFPAYQFTLVNKRRTHENCWKSALCGNHGNIWVARMI